MLIIGHRGAAGEKPENTLTSLRTAHEDGAAIIECDVRLTHDNVLILSHDPTLERTHKMPLEIRKCTYKELKKRTAGSSNPITTLREVLEAMLSYTLINVVIHDKGCGIKVLEELTVASLKPHAENVMLSSTSVRELIRIRNLNKKVKLCLIMKLNPFMFLAWERRLGLTAVGFHRLHAPQLAIDAARKLDIFTYIYTVNRTQAIPSLAQQHIDAIVTDYPSKFIKYLEKSSKS